MTCVTLATCLHKTGTLALVHVHVAPLSPSLSLPTPTSGWRGVTALTPPPQTLPYARTHRCGTWTPASGWWRRR